MFLDSLVNCIALGIILLDRQIHLQIKHSYRLHQEISTHVPLQPIKISCVGVSTIVFKHNRPSVPSTYITSGSDFSCALDEDNMHPAGGIFQVVVAMYLVYHYKAWPLEMIIFVESIMKAIFIAGATMKMDKFLTPSENLSM